MVFEINPHRPWVLGGAQNSVGCMTQTQGSTHARMYQRCSECREWYASLRERSPHLAASDKCLSNEVFECADRINIVKGRLLANVRR